MYWIAWPTPWREGVLGMHEVQSAHVIFGLEPLWVAVSILLGVYALVMAASIPGHRFSG